MSDLISLIAQRNAHASHRLLKTLKTFFRWCVGRAVIDFSPVEGISSPYREVVGIASLLTRSWQPLFYRPDECHPHTDGRRIPGNDRSKAGRGRSTQMGRTR